MNTFKPASKASPKVISLTPEAVRALHFIHEIKCCTASMLADVYNVRTEKISRLFAELEAGGWIREMGWAQRDPRLGIKGSWWIPSRRNPAGIFWESALRAVVKPLTEEETENRRCIEFKHGWLRRHDVLVSQAACTAIAYLKQQKAPLRFESETTLRTVRGWYANLTPANIAKGGQGQLCTVPDFRFLSSDPTEGRAISVEIELSRKSLEAYRRIVDQCEQGCWMVFACPTKVEANALADVYRRVGNGRAARLNSCVIEDLPNVIEWICGAWHFPGFTPRKNA